MQRRMCGTSMMQLTCNERIVYHHDFIPNYISTQRTPARTVEPWSRKLNRFSPKRARPIGSLAADSWNCTTFATRNGPPRTSLRNTRASRCCTVRCTDINCVCNAYVSYSNRAGRKGPETCRFGRHCGDEETTATQQSLASRHQRRPRVLKTGHIRRYNSNTEHPAESQEPPALVSVHAKSSYRRQYGSTDVCQTQRIGPTDLPEKQAYAKVRVRIGWLQMGITDLRSQWFTYTRCCYHQLEFSRLQDRIKYMDVLQLTDNTIAKKIRMDLKNSETRMKAIKTINRAYQRIITSMMQACSSVLKYWPTTVYNLTFRRIPFISNRCWALSKKTLKSNNRLLLLAFDLDVPLWQISINWAKITRYSIVCRFNLVSLLINIINCRDYKSKPNVI